MGKIIRRAWADPNVVVASLTAVITGVISWVAYLQWRTMQGQLNIMEADERAWLRVEYGLPPQFIAANAVVQIQIKNVGKSVALRSFADTTLEIADSKRGPSFKLGGLRTNLPAIFPTDVQAFPVTPTHSDGSVRPVTTEEVQDLLNGKAYIAIFGQVVYSDQFGQHWTRYCTWRPVRGPVIINDRFNTGPCVAWEGVGDGKPPI